MVTRVRDPLTGIVTEQLDPYGAAPGVFPTIPVRPVGSGPTSLLRTVGDPGLINTRDTNAFPGAPVVDPGAPTGLPGSPLNTLYGVDSESYLTEEQKKLSRQIQGKFDASMNSRDRALQQYGAPRLASFAEDEALARAMSLARGLNFPTDVPGKVPELVRSASPISAPRPNPGPTTPAETAKTGPSTFAKAQQIIAGLASLVPLLFGRDAYGQLLNKGLIQSVKESIFGKDIAPSISDAALEKMVASGGMPTNGPIAYNPVTGEPMGFNANWSPGGLGDPYGPSANWGQTAPDASLNVGGDWWSNPVDTSGWWDTGGLDTSGWDFGSLGGP